MKDGRLHEKTEKRNRKKLKTSQNVLEKNNNLNFMKEENYISKRNKGKVPENIIEDC